MRMRKEPFRIPGGIQGNTTGMPQEAAGRSCWSSLENPEAFPEWNESQGRLAGRESPASGWSCAVLPVNPNPLAFPWLWTSSGMGLTPVWEGVSLVSAVICGVGEKVLERTGKSTHGCPGIHGSSKGIPVVPNRGAVLPGESTRDRRWL